MALGLTPSSSQTEMPFNLLHLWSVLVTTWPSLPFGASYSPQVPSNLPIPTDLAQPGCKFCELI